MASPRNRRRQRVVSFYKATRPWWMFWVKLEKCGHQVLVSPYRGEAPKSAICYEKGCVV